MFASAYAEGKNPVWHSMAMGHPDQRELERELSKYFPKKDEEEKLETPAAAAPAA